MSGSTGAIYGVRLLDVLSQMEDVETHLVMTKAAKMTLQIETDYTVKEVEAMADVVHDISNVGASISSGSFRTAGMIVAPCSIKSMSSIAHSLGGDLLTRAADVVMKERKKLVILVRETPLHTGHLEIMASLSKIGAVIMPPVPAFYHRPKTLDDIINQTVSRALDQFEIETDLFQRWGELKIQKAKRELGEAKPALSAHKKE